MLDLNECIKKLEDSEVYIDWRKENKKSFLYLFFKIMKEDDKGIWEIGFYDQKTETSTSFIIGEDVKLNAKDSKIFKKKDDKIEKLNVDDIKIDLENAFKIIDGIIGEKYSKEKASEKIIILQNVGSVVWNITYLTKSLNVINVRISASSGDIIEHSIKPALSFSGDS